MDGAYRVLFIIELERANEREIGQESTQDIYMHFGIYCADSFFSYFLGTTMTCCSAVQPLRFFVLLR